MASKKWAINLRDTLHGALMAGIGAVGSALTLTLASGAIPTEGDVKKSAVIGLSVGLGYLLKKLTEDENGKILKSKKEKQQ